MEKISDLDQARQIALRRLSVRSRSVRELRSDLINRHVSDEVADQVVARFLEVGLLDDGAFAQAWVKSRRHMKSLSSNKLRAELLDKGVDEASITQVLQGEEEAESDEVVAIDLARRSMKALHNTDAETTRRRLAAKLERRGFSYSTVRRAVTTVMQEAEIGILSGDE